MLAHSTLLQNSLYNRAQCLRISGHAKEPVDDIGLAVELVMDHDGEDSHLGSAPVVELDSPLPLLILGGKVVPSEVQGSVAEVSWELSRFGSVGGVLHDKQLKETNEGNELEETCLRDGVEGSEAVGDGSEGGSVVVNVPREVSAHSGGYVSSDGKHGNASMLDLDVAEAIWRVKCVYGGGDIRRVTRNKANKIILTEALLISIVEETKRVPEPKGRLGSDLFAKER